MALGRPPGTTRFDLATRKEMARRYDRGDTLALVAQDMGCSAATVSRQIRGLTDIGKTYDKDRRAKALDAKTKNRVGS